MVHGDDNLSGAFKNMTLECTANQRGKAAIAREKMKQMGKDIPVLRRAANAVVHCSNLNCKDKNCKHAKVFADESKNHKLANACSNCGRVGHNKKTCPQA